jgi:autotransporter-associated beta strand protein
VTNSLQLTVATTAVLTKTWQGDGSLNRWDIATGLDWTNTLGTTTTTYVYNDGDFVTINDTATNLTLNLTASVAPSSVTVTNSVNNYLLQGAGSLGGSSGLTKQGSASFTIANTTANTYSGVTTLSGGTLQIGNNNAAGSLGTGAVSVNAAGTTLAFNRTDAITVTNTIAGTAAALPNIRVNSGTVTLSGTADNAYATAAVTNGTVVSSVSSRGVVPGA